MKIKTIATLVALMPLSLYANLEHAPKSFALPEGTVIYTDFKTANYALSYDLKSKSVTATSTITFETKEEGFPAFDLVEAPISMSLDGEEVSSRVIASPDRDTKFRIAAKSIKPGIHTFLITSPVKENVSFTADGVSSAFWFTDLDDRGYMETYLPANLEYDQYKVTLDLDFKSMAKQRIYTNGVVTNLDNNRFQVVFPETYTSSSIYFHTAPIGRYPEKTFTFRSIDGRDIPVTVYSASTFTSLDTLQAKTLKSLTGLEAKYGPFLHNTVTVFNAGSGGMEYCGATMTDMGALNHELTHSYFARGGLMPANGNSGWLDEAITSWSDEGAISKPEINGTYANMAGNSEYRRYTHMGAYTQGKSFMGHLNYKFQSQGGLVSFLNEMIKTDSFTPMTTEEFVKKISNYYSEDLMPLFKKHTYSSKSRSEKPNKMNSHMKLTIKEMKQFL